MSPLFPLTELAMIATAFAAMGVLVAYASWAKRHGHSGHWRAHNMFLRRLSRK